VLLGLVLLTVALCARAIEEPRIWKRAALTVALCALAMTVTPLGVSFWTEIPRSLARIRLYPLDEWKRPGLETYLLPFWIIAAIFCGALIAKRRELWRRQRLVICATAGLLLPMAILARRNVGPFLMIAVPALTMLIPRTAGRRAAEPASRHALNFGIMAVASGLVAVTIGFAYYREIPRLRWRPVPALAVAALDKCPGNLYNRYDEGGELIWFVPGRRVFIDGRQDPFPPALVLEHIKMETTGADYRPAFALHDIRCAYLPTISPTAAALANAGWTTLYRDDRWVVLRDNSGRSTASERVGESGQDQRMVRAGRSGG
jgi:hypothetical protein